MNGTRWKRRTWLQVSLAVVLAGSLATIAACGQRGETEKKQSLRVGVILPLTGEASSYGVDCRRGIELAATQQSKVSGAQFVFEDSKADPKQAVSAIQKLINVDRVQVILGDMFSSTTLAIAPIAQQNGIVLVTPTAAAKDIPATGDSIFTIYPSAAFEGEFMARHAVREGIKTAGIMVQNVAAAEEIATAFADYCSKNNVRLIYTQGFPGGTSDFKSMIAATRQHKVDAIFISAYGPETCRFLRQAKELGIGSQMLSQSTLYDQKLLEDYGSAMEGVVFSAPFFTEDAATPAISAFRKAYLGKYGVTPSVWAAYGYDAATLILNASNAVLGTSQPLNSVIKAVSMDGTTGPLSFHADRTAERSMRLFTVRGGSFAAVGDGKP